MGAALSTLAAGNVNITSFTIAETVDYGLLRLIVDDVDRAKQLLADADYAVVEHPVVSAVLPNKPGVLAEVAKLVAESDIDIEYIYLGGRDTLLMRAEQIERLETLLGERGLRVLQSNEEARITGGVALAE